MLMLQVPDQVIPLFKTSFQTAIPYNAEIYTFSDLMGMFDKRRFKKLLLFALNFDIRNPRTHHDVDPHKTTTRELFHRYDLGLDVIEFIGHAIALHNSERSVIGT